VANRQNFELVRKSHGKWKSSPRGPSRHYKLCSSDGRKTQFKIIL